MCKSDGENPDFKMISKLIKICLNRNQPIIVMSDGQKSPHILMLFAKRRYKDH